MSKQLTPEQIQKVKDRRDILISRLPLILKSDPVVDIQLRNEYYRMELDNTAVKDFYKDTGINLIGDWKESEISNPETFSILLLKCLQKNHPELTVDKVDKLIEYRKFMYIRDRVMTCLELFMPDMSDVPRIEDSPEDPT